MLRVGLTGGIGAGKSTVSAAWSERGALVVDGDKIAREVVAPGTPGLAAVVDAFGDGVLAADGSLDRPALAALAFADDERRATLNGIVHPLVGQRRQELVDAAPADAVVVEDIPLLVESGLAPWFPLVVVVHADEDVRLQRLLTHRGMSEADAAARIRAQASESQRRAVADVWLDNSGSPDVLLAAATTLWQQRIVPMAANVEAGRCAPPRPVPVAADPDWPAQARRIVERVRVACGAAALRVDHVGQTAVPGSAAPDVIEVQVTVRTLADADAVADALRTVGLPPGDGGAVRDPVRAVPRSRVPMFDRRVDSGVRRRRWHCAADAARPARVELRVLGWPEQQFALLLGDWLRAGAPGLSGCDAASDPRAYDLAWRWADSTDWQP